MDSIPPDNTIRGNSSIIETIDALNKVGHRIVTVAELINLLAQQSPMMPVVGYNEDEGGPVCLNGIRVDDSGDNPIYILYFSVYPKKNESMHDIQSGEERLAEKKNKALDMAQATRDHMRMVE